MNPNSFKDVFPEIVSQGHAFYQVCGSLAAVAVFAGLVTSSLSGAFGDVRQTLHGLVKASLVVFLIGVFPQLVDLAQDVNHALVEETGSNPEESSREFARLIAGPESADQEGVGFWEILWDDNGGIGKAIYFAVLLLMGKLAMAVMWLAYLVQNFILVIGVAVAPLFLALFTIESLKGIAGRYLTSLFATICWPFGWCVMNLVTSGLIRTVAADPGASEFALILIITSLWMLASAIGVPMGVHKLFVHGSQLGLSLLGSAGTAASQGLGYGVGAGVSASLAGSGRWTTAAATVAGGIGGVVTGATGRSGMLIPTMIGTAAVMASSGSTDGNKAAEMADKLRRGNA